MSAPAPLLPTWDPAQAAPLDTFRIIGGSDDAVLDLIHRIRKGKTFWASTRDRIISDDGSGPAQSFEEYQKQNGQRCRQLFQSWRENADAILKKEMDLAKEGQQTATKELQELERKAADEKWPIEQIATAYDTTISNVSKKHKKSMADLTEKLHLSRTAMREKEAQTLIGRKAPDKFRCNARHFMTRYIEISGPRTSPADSFWMDWIFVSPTVADARQRGLVRPMKGEYVVEPDLTATEEQLSYARKTGQWIVYHRNAKDANAVRFVFPMHTLESRIGPKVGPVRG
jgi:hypothetical protein